MIGNERESNQGCKCKVGTTRIKRLFAVIGIAILIFLCFWLLAIVQNANTERQTAMVNCARSNIIEIEKAIQLFIMSHNGKMPDTLEELTQESNDKPAIFREHGLVDPWGTKYSYRKSEKTFTITSAGPDRKLGTADDLVD